MHLGAAAKQPAHLVMGSDAVQRMHDRIARDTAETEKWTSVSVSTDSNLWNAGHISSSKVRWMWPASSAHANSPAAPRQPQG